jgi:hypothetical protein
LYVIAYSSSLARLMKRIQTRLLLTAWDVAMFWVSPLLTLTLYMLYLYVYVQPIVRKAGGKDPDEIAAVGMTMGWAYRGELSTFLYCF